MPVTVTCSCGASYSLKDEFAGRVMQCPKCGQSIQAPPPLARQAQADPAFDRDKFLLRQKVMSINEKYAVWDEQQQPVLFVERPAHLLQQIAALLLGIIIAIVFIGGAVALAGTFFKNNEAAFGITLLIGILLGIGVAAAVAIAISPKRHVHFYRDESRSQELLKVLQDSKFQPITATYTVLDPSGQQLARFRKNYLYNLIRKRWWCDGADGRPICEAMEDSIILSLLRRFLGPFFGLLRTNFIIVRPGTEDIIGEFNRKLTLFDRYVLDMTPDPARNLDRRIALALGVMLDTGERR